MDWGWANYVPGVSNVKGVIDGNFNQALAGPIGYLAGEAAGKPYEKAAAGARGVAGDARGFSDTQWNRQMEGLDKAQGAYGPSMGLWNAMGHAPGAMENWWGANQDKFRQPTATSGALSGFQSYMQGGPQYSGGAYGQAQGMIGGPTTSQGIYDRYSGQLGNPSASENAYSQYRNAGTFNGSTRQESNEQILAESYNDLKRQAEMANSGRGRELGSAFAGENIKMDSPTIMQAFADSVGHMQGDSALRSGGQEIGGYYRGASDPTDYYNSQKSALQGPGTYEQFVQSDIMGNNPALEMERKKSEAALNQQLARRGAFNSGAAGAAFGELEGTLAAKSYENRANRAQQAQQMQLGRIGQGTQTATASGQQKLAQGQGLQGLARDQDQESRARIDQLMAAKAAASGEALSGQRLGLDAAQLGDQTRLARLGLGMQSDSQGNAQQLAALQGLQGVYSNADNSMFQRVGAGMSAAGQSDQQMQQRLAQMYGMGQGLDANNLARGNALFGMGQGMDQQAMAQYGMYGQLAGQQDQAAMARLMGAGQMAGNAQGAQQQRESDMFAQLFGINNAQGSQVGQFYNQGGQLSGQSYNDYLNAMLNSYGMQAQGGAARAQLPFQVAGLGIEGAKAYYGGGG